jgi:hypothetical protein
MVIVALAPTGDWKEYEKTFEAMLATLKLK